MNLEVCFDVILTTNDPKGYRDWYTDCIRIIDGRFVAWRSTVL
jgi:hypothetical protein